MYFHNVSQFVCSMIFNEKGQIFTFYGGLVGCRHVAVAIYGMSYDNRVFFFCKIRKLNIKIHKLNLYDNFFFCLE